MNEMEFDKALSNFLDDTQCEAVSEALFGLVRSADSCHLAGGFSCVPGYSSSSQRRKLTACRSLPSLPGLPGWASPGAPFNPLLVPYR